MIKVRSFFPPKKRDQAILTEPYFNNHKPLYRPFKHKNSESLFSLKKFNHHKKCFYEKKNIDFKKIKDKEDDQAKALEAKVLKVHISQKQNQIMREQLTFYDSENEEQPKLISISLENIFENFLKFHKKEINGYVLDGCIKSKLIKPFLRLYKKLEIESDQNYIGINSKNIKGSLFSLFEKFRPKQYLNNEIKLVEQKNNQLYFQMYEKYENTPFYEQKSLNKIQSNISIKLSGSKKNYEIPKINKLKIVSRKQTFKSLATEKEKQDSLIRLRFKENLRKQVNRLSIDTKNILQKKS